MKRCRLHQFGRIPEANEQEKLQFERVLKTISEYRHYLGEWIVVCIGVNYQHAAGDRLDNDFDWNGEYDLLLLANRRIIVYELKSAEITLFRGRSDGRPWVFREDDGRKVKRKSQFDQVSRQRAAFLQDFLESSGGSQAAIANKHFKVDHRLVIPDSADYSRFYFTFPHDLDDDELDNELIPSIDDAADRDFVRSMYSRPFKRKGSPARRLKPRPAKSEMERLANIMPEAWHGKRIKRWFRILKESEIEADLAVPGYLDFELTETEGRKIAQEMLSNP